MQNEMIELSKYFSKEELACPCCGEVKLFPGFAELLYSFRVIRKEPMIITSAYRCPKHNEEIGGAKQSQHVEGLAIDFYSKAGVQQLEDIALAKAMGFSIGIGKGWLHIDARYQLTDKLQTSWTY